MKHIWTIAMLIAYLLPVDLAAQEFKELVKFDPSYEAVKAAKGKYQQVIIQEFEEFGYLTKETMDNLVGDLEIIKSLDGISDPAKVLIVSTRRTPEGHNLVCLPGDSADPVFTIVCKYNASKDTEVGYVNMGIWSAFKSLTMTGNKDAEN